MMVLIDTSVWIDHLHRADQHMGLLLENDQVIMHPMVIGELALGHLANRQRALEDLADMPEISVATQEEFLYLIDTYRLMGTGISYVDANLLASVVAHGDTKLWSRDRRLNQVAIMFDVAYKPVVS